MNYVALTQEIPVEPDTPYRLQGFIKTNLPLDAKAYFNTEQLDADKNPVTTRRRWRSNRDHALTGHVEEWTERELSVRTGGNTSFIRIYLEVEQSKKDSQGSAWFSDLSFEKKNEKKTEYVFNGKGPAENLLNNSRFERASKRYTTFPEGWERLDSGDKGTIRLDTREKLSGAQSIQLCPDSTTEGFGHLSLTQIVPVERDQTYTLSGYIRTNLCTDAFAFLNAEQLDARKEPIPVSDLRWKDNRYSKLTGTQDWTKRQVTFKTSPTTSFVRVYLEVDHNQKPTDGSAWFDHIQLERGSVSSAYNLVENSSFEREEETESGLVKWYASSGESAIDTEEGASGGQSIQFHRLKTTDPLKQLSQVIPINQSKPAPITISGMV
jgi:hypothetical protein